MVSGLSRFCAGEQQAVGEAAGREITTAHPQNNMDTYSYNMSWWLLGKCLRFLGISPEIRQHNQDNAKEPYTMTIEVIEARAKHEAALHAVVVEIRQLLDKA